MHSTKSPLSICITAQPWFGTASTYPPVRFGLWARHQIYKNDSERRTEQLVPLPHALLFGPVPCQAPVHVVDYLSRHLVRPLHPRPLELDPCASPRHVKPLSRGDVLKLDSMTADTIRQSLSPFCAYLPYLQPTMSQSNMLPSTPALQRGTRPLIAVDLDDVLMATNETVAKCALTGDSMNRQKTLTTSISGHNDTYKTESPMTLDQFHYVSSSP